MNGERWSRDEKPDDGWLICRLLQSVITVWEIDGKIEPEVSVLSEQGVMTIKLVETLKRYGVEGQLFAWCEA